MLELLKRRLAIVSRWGESHGFGVQSPFAYNFVMDVVRGSAHHKDYETLANVYPENRRRRSLHQFYLRLSSFLNMSLWYSNVKDAAMMKYVLSGNENVVFQPNISMANVFILSVDYGVQLSNLTQLCIDITANADENTVIVLENIHMSRFMCNLWAKVVCDERSGVTFDLYDCGVAYFDHNYFKMNYKVTLP